jgi:hypothetical protein
MDILIVTAYYPVKTGKHSRQDYMIWIANFFECVTCPVYFFCSSEMYNTLKNMSKSNVTFIQREFDSFDMMKEPWKSRWENFHKIDYERNIHSPELYAIWAAKQEFLREAIKLQDSNCYIWCDAGCFRTKRDGSFKNVINYIEPEKITCLHICNTIGAGVLAGDKNAWNLFSNNYLEELEKNINGKEQVIYEKILNKDNAVIIEPTNEYGDPWFYLTSLFSHR